MPESTVQNSCDIRSLSANCSSCSRDGWVNIPGLDHLHADVLRQQSMHSIAHVEIGVVVVGTVAILVKNGLSLIEVWQERLCHKSVHMDQIHLTTLIEVHPDSTVV